MTSDATRRRLRWLALAVLLVGAGMVVAQPRAPRSIACDSPAVRVFKSRGRLELWCGGVETAHFAATFGAHPVGPKEREGDERTPEGDYAITSRVTTPRFHRFMGVSYPNAADRARGAALGITHLGRGIGIHGTQRAVAVPARLWIRLSSGIGLSNTWGPTDGCIALANEDVEVIYSAVRVGTPIHIAP